jgi:hypothetical protein
MVPFTELYRQEASKLLDSDILRFLSEIGKPGKQLEKLEMIFRHPSSLGSYRVFQHLKSTIVM